MRAPLLLLALSTLLLRCAPVEAQEACTPKRALARPARLGGDGDRCARPRAPS